MNGTSLRPWITASLWIRIEVSLSPMRGMASRNLVRQVEILSRPVSGQVLRPPVDRAVLFNQARTANPDEWSKPEFLLVRGANEAFEHADQLVHRLVALDLLVRMAPELRFPDLGLLQLRRFLQIELDHSNPDVGAADIDRKNRVVSLEQPGRRKVPGPDQACFVGMVADRRDLDVDLCGLQQQRHAADDEFADPAVAQTAANHDPLGVPPCLGLEIAPDHGLELLRKLLDRGVDHARSLRVSLGQQGVDLVLGQFMGVVVADRIVAVLAKVLAQHIQNFAKRPLVGAVADKTVFIAQLDIVGIDLD